MLEREIADAGFVPRWSIVRTLMPQSVAEHSFFVAIYANDIATMFNLSDEIKLAVLQYALWHDVDEVFSGDMPGPNKRALFNAMGKAAEENWKFRITKWMDRVFPGWYMRSGGDTAHHKDLMTSKITKLVVKAADWLEASVRMATEHQMGNGNVRRHIDPNKNGCLETLHSLYTLLGGKVKYDEVAFDIKADSLEDYLRTANQAVEGLIGAAACGLSRGPWITGEDDSRDYREPCVDGKLS